MRVLDYKESWALKNWCFWTLLLEKTLKFLLETRSSKQSILKEISPDYSLEGLMPKLKLQYFGHLMWRTDSLEKTLRLGKIEGRRRRGQKKMRWLDGITDSITWVWASSGSWWWTRKPGMLQSMGSQIAGHYWATELNWSLKIIITRSLGKYLSTLKIINEHRKQIFTFFLEVLPPIQI